MAGNDGNACPTVSRELLFVEGREGISETLLLGSKHAKKKSSRVQTVRLPKSNILDKVQNFLPKMACANNRLIKEMENRPGQEFDIEHVDSSMEKVIEMNVALVELSGSDTEEEESVSEDDWDCEDSCLCEEVTEENIKLPLPKGEGRIEILDSKT